MPGLDAIDEDSGRAACASARWSTLARLAADAEGRASAIPRSPTPSAAFGEPADPQLATLGGNLLQRPRCWYFRSPRIRCLRKGGGHCFAIAGENRYHAIFDNRYCAIVHPSTAATALVALGASLELVDDERRGARLRLEEFFVGPERDVSARTTCGRRDPDRDRCCRRLRPACAWRT